MIKGIELMYNIITKHPHALTHTHCVYKYFLHIEFAFTNRNGEIGNKSFKWSMDICHNCEIYFIMNNLVVMADGHQLHSWVI